MRSELCKCFSEESIAASATTTTFPIPYFFFNLLQNRQKRLPFKSIVFKMSWCRWIASGLRTKSPTIILRDFELRLSLEKPILRRSSLRSGIKIQAVVINCLVQRRLKFCSDEFSWRLQKVVYSAFSCALFVQVFPEANGKLYPRGITYAHDNDVIVDGFLNLLIRTCRRAKNEDRETPPANLILKPMLSVRASQA